MCCKDQYWSPFFSLFINNLLQGLNSKVKLMFDDTSLFSIINCVNASDSTFNSDVLKIQDWAYHWKMSFNPNQTKQTQEVMFSTNMFSCSPPLFFNNSEINFAICNFQSRPALLFAWWILSFMCSLRDNLLSRVSPRGF